MAVITNGTIIPNADAQTPGSVTRVYVSNGAPVAGTTYDGVIQVGEVVEDVTTGDLYEYTEPSGAATFTRIDTA